MSSIKLSDLRPHSYLNHGGELITKEQAEAMIAAGSRPLLYTVSDDHIQAALYDLSRARREGREPGDYTAPDPGAQRVIYDEPARDFKADLGQCAEAATLNMQSHNPVGRLVRFASEAVTGWPYAIRRAQAAEEREAALLEELGKLQDYINRGCRAE